VLEAQWPVQARFQIGLRPKREKFPVWNAFASAASVLVWGTDEMSASRRNLGIHATPFAQESFHFM